jgi:hypothetical protein
MPSSMRQQTRISCTKCGTSADTGARFCNKCGFPLATPGQIEASEPFAQSQSSEKWSYPFPSLENEEVQQEFSPVTVKWLKFEFNDQRYETPILPRPFLTKILVTNQRIVLLDPHNNPVRGEIMLRHLPRIAIDERGKEHKVYERHAYPMAGGKVPLSPFWAFKRTANEGLYKEFMSQPGEYSKVRGAWWVHGYRGWSWVEDVCGSDQGKLEFTLEAVRAFSQWGPGRQVPTSYPEGKVSLSFEPAVDTTTLQNSIKGWKDSKPVFREEFLASIPYKPETPAFKAYTNVFWVAVAEVIPLGVLWGMEAPPWVMLLVGIGVAWFTLHLLKRFPIVG